LYVYYGARQAFAFYGPRAGVAASSVVYGGCHRLDPAAYVRELEGLVGHSRVWVLVAHDIPFLKERPLILGYLRRAGHETTEFRARTPNRMDPTVYQFDLSGPGTERVRAMEFPTPVLTGRALEAARRLGCNGGPQTPDPELPP
jgi:hypothetical protein